MRSLPLVLALALAASPSLAQPKKKKKPAPASVTPKAGPPAADPAPPAAKPTVAEVVSRMQKFYEGTQDLHAAFDQTMESPIRAPRTFAGDVWLKKPGRMRWDYQKPEKKLMVADGTSLWVYEPEEQQAIKQPLKESTLPSSVSFLFGTGRLSDEFDITEEHPPGVGGEGDVVLKLVPKKPTAQYRYLLFVVDPKRWMVKESYLYDQQDGVNHIRFHDVETNKNVASSKFEFAPPAGTRIVRP